jgi:hypothetical protein
MIVSNHNLWNQYNLFQTILKLDYSNTLYLMCIQILENLDFHASYNYYSHRRCEEVGRAHIPPISYHGQVSNSEVKHHNHRYHK